MSKLKVFAWILIFIGFAVGCSVTENKDDNYYKDGGILYSPEYLNGQIEKKLIVPVDVRATGYDEGHIKGALWLDPQYLILKADKSSDMEKFKQKISDMGIDQDSRVVIYADKMSTDYASRLYFLLSYIGANDIHILNGGWDAWIDKGLSVTTDVVALKGIVFLGKDRTGLVSDTKDVEDAIQSKGYAVVDARSDEEFNGWRFYGEKRGGHIPYSFQISKDWVYDGDKKFTDPVSLLKLIEKRGIKNDRKIIVYGKDAVESSVLFTAFKLMGFKDVSSYEGSIRSWAKSKKRKMERLKRYEKIVSASWVKNLIDGKSPETFKGGKYVILETRYMSSTTTKANADPEKISYIPGAVSIHPCYLEHKNNKKKYYPKYTEPGDGNLLPKEELVKAIGELGISKDTMVVVYGSGVIIPMTSARVAWALMYAGVKDVRILNGGYSAWLKKGYEVSDKPSEPVKVDFGADKPMRPDLLATMNMVRKIADGKEKDCVMVDVRRKEENIGNLNPYPFFTKTGKIPGAVWMGNWVELVDMNDNTFRSYTEVRDLWKNLGITKDREAIYYCGTGWRSSIGFFTAYVMGFEKMRNYDGSFYEWSWYPENRLSD